MYRIHSVTVPGRLKSKMAQTWTGSEEIYPSEQLVWRKIMASWRTNPHGAKIAFHLFNPPPIHDVNFNRKLNVRAASKLLRRLAGKSPMHRLLTQSKFSKKQGGAVACLILGVEEPAYHAFVMVDGDDSDELRATQLQSRPQMAWDMWSRRANIGRLENLKAAEAIRILK